MAEDDKKNDKPTEEEEPPLAEPIQSKPAKAAAPPPSKSAPPPAAAPPPMPPPDYYQKKPFDLKVIAHDYILLVFIMVGLILMLVGTIISVSSVEKSIDIEDEDDYEDYIKSLKNGTIIFNVGGFLLALFLLIGGLVRDDLNQYARLGMFIAAAIIIFKLTLANQGMVSISYFTG